MVWSGLVCLKPSYGKGNIIILDKHKHKTDMRGGTNVGRWGIKGEVGRVHPDCRIGVREKEKKSRENLKRLRKKIQ